MSDELNDASAGETALLNAMRATFLPGSAPLARREAREKGKATPKQRQAGTRAARKSSERTAQCNIKMHPTVKARLMAYCKRHGLAVTDWLEEVVLQLPEG